MQCKLHKFRVLSQDFGGKSKKNGGNLVTWLPAFWMYDLEFLNPKMFHKYVACKMVTYHDRKLVCLLRHLARFDRRCSSVSLVDAQVGYSG